MNDPFTAALDRALEGDAQVLDGLGIEEAMLTSSRWDDRIAVDGKGVVTFTSKRPSGDSGALPIGIFRGKMEKNDLLAVIRSLRDLAASPPPPSRAEAYETRILLSAVAGGHQFGIGVPAFPPAMAPLQPILRPLGRAMSLALQHPVRSLSLRLELPKGVGREGRVSAVLHLINGGTEGFWVSNPAAVSNQPERERMQLVYARPIVFTPGVAPIPVPPAKTLMSPPDAEPRPRYLWVPPKGDVPVPLVATIDTGDANELVLRAELFAEEGEATVAGQPRLKGTVFSPDVKVPVK